MELYWILSIMASAGPVLLAFVLETELRWHHMFNLLTGSTSEDNAARFVNESDDILHIRLIDRAVLGDDFAAGEVGMSELSKAPALQAVTDESPFWSSQIPLGGDQAVDSPTALKVLAFARGQLMLRPQEGVYLNMTVAATATIEEYANFGFHF